MQSQAQILALIEREKARGISSSRIVLAGFSQGGAIALQTGLRIDQPLAAMVILSSYLPLASSVPAQSTPTGRSIPVFMGHGRQDTMILLTRAQASRDALAALGVKVQWHEYVMAHSVDQDELADIARFLSEALK